jgi:hypothetical protein
MLESKKVNMLYDVHAIASIHMTYSFLRNFVGQGIVFRNRC